MPIKFWVFFLLIIVAIQQATIWQMVELDSLIIKRIDIASERISIQHANSLRMAKALGLTVTSMEDK